MRSNSAFYRSSRHLPLALVARRRRQLMLFTGAFRQKVQLCASAVMVFLYNAAISPALNCTHNEMKRKQNRFETVLKQFCFVVRTV